MTNERHDDDEVLGRALSRAIETQDLRETPFDESRIAARSGRRGFPLWQLAGVAAVLVLALAFGSWFTRPTATGPVAASSTPTVPATGVPTPTSAPASSLPGGNDQLRVFFVRDALPPVSAVVRGTITGASAEGRVVSRLTAARDAGLTSVPGGATNPLSLVGRSGYAISAHIAGDTANVEFDLPQGWNVHGAAQVQALVQQLVYVITEESGIRKARITEKGKTNAVIDGLIVDKPLSREDVTDYDTLDSTKTAQGYGDAAPNKVKLTTRTSVESVAPGLARFVIESDLQNVGPTQMYPDFKIEVRQNDETANPLGGKWRMVVAVYATDTTTGTQTIDRSPLRSIVATPSSCAGCVGTIYDIGMDDLRPWRTAIAYNPFRIIIDIGGDPRMLWDTNAVYAPAYGSTVGRTFQVSGIAHNFEAHVDIRVLDEKLKEIARTFTTATNCCDPGGTFEATVQLPAGTTGKVYLEVFEASAKDGSDTKVIRVPLTVR